MKTNAISTDKSQDLAKKMGKAFNIVFGIAGFIFCVIGIYMQTKDIFF